MGQAFPEIYLSLQPDVCLEKLSRNAVACERATLKGPANDILVFKIFELST